MQAAPRRITLYRLPEAPLAAVAPSRAIRPTSGATAPPFRDPRGTGEERAGRHRSAPPRILAVPAPAPPAAEGSIASWLMAVSTLAGVRAYAEAQQLRVLWQGPFPDSGSRLDRRL